MTPIPILDLGTWLLLEAIVSGTINLCVFSEKFILGNLEKFIGFFRRRCCKMRNFGLKISVNKFPFYKHVFFFVIKFAFGTGSDCSLKMSRPVRSVREMLLFGVRTACSPSRTPTV